MMRSRVRLREPHGIWLKKWYLLRWIGVRTYSPEEDALYTTSQWLLSRQSNDVYLLDLPIPFCLHPPWFKAMRWRRRTQESRSAHCVGTHRHQLQMQPECVSKNKETASSRSRRGRHTCCCCWRYTLTDFQNSREITKNRFSTDKPAPKGTPS